jgi:hypothetical protein
MASMHMHGRDGRIAVGAETMCLFTIGCGGALQITQVMIGYVG